MYGQINEDLAWQRMKDLQREMENSRLMAAGLRPAALVALWRLADWLGTFTWQAGRRAAMAGQRRRADVAELDGETGRDRVA
jgi:hypothetical protein